MYLKSAVLIFVIFTVFELKITLGENILFFLPVGSYSHRIPMWPLVTHLADHGHNVTFVSAFPPKEPHPNVTEIVPEEFKVLFGTFEEKSVVEQRRKGEMTAAVWNMLPEIGLKLCDIFLSRPETKDWVEKSQFDLVIIDGLYNDCGLGLVYKFKAKLMVYSTSAPAMWQIDGLGMIPETNWIPDMQHFFPLEMNLAQRMKSAYNILDWNWKRENNYFPKLEEIIKKRLNLTNLPRLREIEKNVSLVLLNSHYSEEFARSLPPHVIPVGGMHIQDKRKPLSKEIADFIGKADKGFVYVSFGSHVKLSKEPAEVYAAIIGAMKKLDLNFLWKWEGEVPSDIPSNILMQKWISQQDILAHPKIKAFVTHSGLMSITEAIYHGVPLISLQVTAEQDYNAERIHARGYGVRLGIGSFTANDLAEALTKVVENPL